MSISTKDDGIYKDGKRVAYYDEEGNLRMTRGNAPLRKEIEAWELGPPDQAEPEPEEAPADPVPSGNEPPAGDPTMGDKDPKVIAWWFANRPAEAAKRYKDRKGKNLEPYAKR